MPLNEQNKAKPDKRSKTSAANGKKSQGPKTPEGKAISSRNAIRHGLVAKHLVLDRESAPRFAALLTEMHDQFRPRTPIESAEVDNMALCRWRQIRIWNIEKAILDEAIGRQEIASPDSTTAARAADAFIELSHHSGLALVARYESRYDLQYTRAVARFQALRVISGANEQNEPNSPHGINNFAEINEPESNL
jgi:hypothetical protein